MRDALVFVISTHSQYCAWHNIGKQNYKMALFSLTFFFENQHTCAPPLPIFSYFRMLPAPPLPADCSSASAVPVVYLLSSLSAGPQIATF